MKWYLNGFKNYARFRGRASRTEFWTFYFFSALVICLSFGIDLALIDYLHIDFPYLTVFYLVGSTLPFLAVGVRRLHDCGLSGTYYLIRLVPFGGIILIALFCLASQPRENRFGPVPEEESSAA